jgi:hypothetical protein
VYNQKQIVLVTNKNYGTGNFYQLVSNGTHVRDSSGVIVGKIDFKKDGIFYQGYKKSQYFSGTITDQKLNERIKEYLFKYYGKKYTNCSAFVNFLTTGNFIECKKDLNLFVINQHMREYKKTDQVKVGDMVCIIYANQKLAVSRRTPFRKKFLQIRKEVRQNKTFNHSFRLEKTIFTPAELCQIGNNHFTQSYHFMVCVDINQGEPVWLSQNGCFEPGGEVANFLVSKGFANPYLKDIPVATLIKKFH